mgnify:FL=1
MDHVIEGTEQLLDPHLELQRRRLVLVVRDDDPAAVVSEFLHLLENQCHHLLIATALALEVERSLRARGAYDPDAHEADALRYHVTHTAVLREIIHRSQREVEMRRLMVGPDLLINLLRLHPCQNQLARLLRQQVHLAVSA